MVLEDVVVEIIGYDGYELKCVMCIGMVVLLDNWNWEFWD